MHGQSDNNLGYNGWSNFETWATGLWLNNDQGTYEFVRALVGEYGTDYEAAQALKEHIEEMNPLEDQASLYTDLLRAAIGEINWTEVIEHFREE